MIQHHKNKNNTQWAKMIKNFKESDNSEQIVYSLPHEVWNYIVDVYCVSEKKEVSRLSETEILTQLKFFTELMRTEIKNDRNVAESRRIARECVKIMRYFEEYEEEGVYQ